MGAVYKNVPHPTIRSCKFQISRQIFLFMSIALCQITALQGENYMGAPGDFAPEMQKRALKNKKEPLKIACSMLQI